jgi:hypothetical protein
MAKSSKSSAPHVFPLPTQAWLITLADTLQTLSKRTTPTHDAAVHSTLLNLSPEKITLLFQYLWDEQISHERRSGFLSELRKSLGYRLRWFGGYLPSSPPLPFPTPIANQVSQRIDEENIRSLVPILFTKVFLHKYPDSPVLHAKRVEATELLLKKLYEETVQWGDLFRPDQGDVKWPDNEHARAFGRWEELMEEVKGRAVEKGEMEEGKGKKRRASKELEEGYGTGSETEREKRVKV